MNYKWKELLSGAEQYFLKDQEIMRNFFGDSQFPSSLINKPASDDEIMKLQERLSLTLPPSYKTFLQVSNGFRIVNQLFGNLFSADKVQRLIDFDPSFVNTWYRNDMETVTDEMYFDYSENQRTEWIRANYLKECIAVSDWFDGGIILLNPAIRYGDEYEAWAFANWYPGAVRFKNFWELMHHQCKQYLVLKNS